MVGPVRIPLISVFLSRSTSIFENLAFEEWLFKHHNLKDNGEAVLLWSNTPSVVIGKFQNPYMEADCRFLSKHEINLARRNSGGGAVYHDQGNLNVSILTTQKRHCRPRNMENVSKWINKALGTQVAPNDRDDLVLPGQKKISGTAARISRGRAYHHFTLLVNADLSNLRRSLRSPHAKEIETNATRSVPAAAVGNISEAANGVDVHDIVEILLGGFAKQAEELSVLDVTSADIMNEPRWCEIHKISSDLSTDQWIFGKTPKFRISLRDSENKKQAILVENGRVIESENDLYSVGEFLTKLK